ncbi:NlpC/P60 family protein [Bariatricus sp. HCP28S3_D3]|uniref:NlpC/P60 family protein n=1 Tax=Bariatricus sp. HCP28S3_D3 TaxID=3438901 RepID=UPI003F8B0B82
MYKRILALSLAIYLSLYPVTTFANEEGSIDNVIDLGGDKKSLDEAEEMPDSSYSEEEESPEEFMNEEIEEQPVDDEVERVITLQYQVHVQNIGWQGWKKAGELAGTTGESLRMEAFQIDLGSEELNSQIMYRAHVQDIGWQDWVNGGEIAGTVGKSLRAEALEIKLTGELAEQYDVSYMTHVSNIGDLEYVSNGASAGSQGLGARMEALTIMLADKKQDEDSIPDGRGFVKDYSSNDLTYTAHVQNIGDLDGVISGEIQGTTGEGLRLEGFAVNLDTSALHSLKGDITYRAHIQDIGWQEWKRNGEFAGTTGKSLRIEAIQIQLTGEAVAFYNVYYRTHIQNFGWMGWAKNGEKAGSESISQRMEAFQIVLVPKIKDQSSFNSSVAAYRNTYVYQNPSKYLQIKHKQKALTGGGYNLSKNYMGLKVAYVQRKLGLGVRRAIMDSTTINAVKSFQKKNGLTVNGIVDLTTWKKMGLSENDWYNLGAYASLLKTNPASTRSQCIEAMIDTAYSYLNTEYIIGASGKPGTGVDCSGLVMQALYSAGIDPDPVSPIRHSKPGYEYESRNLWNLPMKHVSYSERQRGDLIFYANSSGTIIHVAIYLGNDKVIESWPDKVVVWPIKNSHRSIIKGVVRPFA